MSLKLTLVCLVIALLFTTYSCERPEERKVEASFEKGKDVFHENGTRAPDTADWTAGESVQAAQASMVEGSKVTEVPEFPFKRILKDANGREIDAEIFGKMDGKIALQRLSDNKRFVLPLEKLSNEDLEFFMGIPEGQHKMVSERGSEKVEEKRKVRRHAEWSEDLEMAKKQAVEERLLIYVLFTGSTWCPPCKKLEKNVLSSSEFEAFADENLILVKFDFPRGGGKHTDKSKEFGVRGFPTVLIMNGEGDTLKKMTGFGKATADDYIKTLEDVVEDGGSGL